jgi:hypothetical protein
MVEDLMELVQNLCVRFNQSRVFMLGHSWGTILSLIGNEKAYAQLVKKASPLEKFAR